MPSCTGEVGSCLRAHVNEDRVLVEVIDEGEGFEHELRRRNFEDLHGRGLLIVDSESSRWGIHEGTTHVWFELERQMAPASGLTASPTHRLLGGRAWIHEHVGRDGFGSTQ